MSVSIKHSKAVFVPEEISGIGQVALALAEMPHYFEDVVIVAQATWAFSSSFVLIRDVQSKEFFVMTFVLDVFGSVFNG